MGMMLGSKSDRLKLGFSIIVIGFLFWAGFVSPATHFRQYFDLSEPAVLGASSQRDESALSRVIAQSDDFFTLMQNGKRFLDEGKYELAQSAFERAAQLQPDFRDAHYLLGYTYLRLYEKYGDYTEENPDPYTQDANLKLARLSLLRARTLDPLSEKIKTLLDKIDF